MPGFHDAHLHYFHSALYLSPRPERFVGENRGRCRGAARPAARLTADSWLLQGWRDYLWNPAGMPSRARHWMRLPHVRCRLARDAHTVAEQLRAGTPAASEESEPPRRWQL